MPLTRRGLPARSDAESKFELPSDAQRRVFLVKEAMLGFREEKCFLVWFDDWSVWPHGQRMHIFERFRMSYGEVRPLIDSPGHTFCGQEIEDAISFVTVAALFLWDCYVVSPYRKRMLFLSHDEYGRIAGDDLGSRVPWLKIISVECSRPDGL